MKKNILLALAVILAAGLQTQCVKSDKHSQGQEAKIIKTETPSRPAGQEHALLMTAPKLDTVRVGFIGLGMRGPSAVERFTHIEGVKILALCDIYQQQVDSCQNILQRAGWPEATGYAGNPDAWKQLCERSDIDLVYICTDWRSHAEMALYAMERGKHVAIEVPAAMNMKDIWALIDASERTRKHCMMLENCIYDFFELTTLNMAQQGVFGEILHAEGAYIHNLDEIWELYWNNWRLDYNEQHRGDVYPTHGIGPVCQALDIHRGDKMNYLVSVDTKAVNGPATVKRLQGRESSNFKNGDHTMTMIRSEKGKTILIQHNVMTPRPYSRMYQLTGTDGFANKYPIEGYALRPKQLTGEGKLIENFSAHDFLSEKAKEALMEKYKHPILKDIEEKAKKVGGHGGMDFIMDYRLIYCLRNGLPLDMDVYDMAEWCCLTELTAISLENNSAPVEIPDFTRGAWNQVQGYRHAFAEQTGK